MIIPFGEYLADLPKLGNPGATTAKNVLPHGVGYKPFNSFTVYSDALTAYCRGAFSAMGSTGDVESFAGDETKLYKLTGTTYNDVSLSAYTTSADDFWSFVRWKNKVLATNFTDNIQSWTLGSSVAFANLTTAVKARHIAAIRDFVMVGNTNDASDGNVPNRVRWSAFDDETDWTVAAATQADYQDLNGNGGWVQAIIGGQEQGVIFQERAIWMAHYVGTPVVFQFNQVEDARGLFAPRAVVAVGNMIFYLSDDGFYRFQGGASVPIGNNKVDKTFFDELDTGYTFRICAAADPVNKIVAWAYPTSNAIGGNPDKILFYDWGNDRWSYAEVNTELLFRSMSLGYTLDTLDTVSASLDDLAFSLDSRVWTGGKLQLSAFNSDHKLGHFTGTAMDGVIETAEFQPVDGQRTEITRITPLVDGGTHTVQMGTRETQAGTISWGNAVSENDSGECPTRSNSRYHRIRVNTSGDFNDAMGVKVNEFVPVGAR